MTRGAPPISVGDAVDHAVHERQVAEVEARLDRAGRRLSDDPLRAADLDAPQARGLLEERLGRDGDARHDHAAGVLALAPSRRRRSSPCRSPRRCTARRRRRSAATALTIRSAPTSCGTSYRIGMPVLIPGSTKSGLAAEHLAQGLLERELERRHDARDDDAHRRLGRPPPPARRDGPSASSPRTDSAISSAVASRRVVSRQCRTSSAPRQRPRTVFVLPTSTASSASPAPAARSPCGHLARRRRSSPPRPCRGAGSPRDRARGRRR